MLQSIVDRQSELSKAMKDSSSLDFKAAIMRYMDFLLKPDNSIKTGWKHLDDKLGGFSAQRILCHIGTLGHGEDRLCFKSRLCDGVAVSSRVYVDGNVCRAIIRACSVQSRHD